MGIGKSRPSSVVGSSSPGGPLVKPLNPAQSMSRKEKSDMLRSRWMTVDEQERQIKEGIEKERARALRAALEEELHTQKKTWNTQNEAIRKVVDKYLENELINNVFIPDFLERRIYMNVTKLVLGLLQETLESINVDFLGHRISLNIEPISNMEEVPSMASPASATV